MLLSPSTGSRSGRGGNTNKAHLDGLTVMEKQGEGLMRLFHASSQPGAALASSHARLHSSSALSLTGIQRRLGIVAHFKRLPDRLGVGDVHNWRGAGLPGGAGRVW